ncbi:myosin phosphatase targeting subunit 75D isoform X2 [Arctopsyche grandis]
MEHSDLVAEMTQVERLTTQERLHLAKRRRYQQLKTWNQREREWNRSKTNTAKKGSIAPASTEKPRNKRNIFFSDSVMLLEAAARNDIEEVRNLLSRGVTPDATNEDGLTALHQCCIDNNEDMLRLLLEKGANVNAEDSERWTPLHAAATCGHLQLVRLLIQHGANLLAVNADGNMPYDICEDESSLDCIEGEMAARGITQRLIDNTRASTERQMLRDLKNLAAVTGDLEYTDHQGATPLHIAAANGYLKVVEFLLDNHVSTDVKDHDLWQPVHAAACWGHLEVLETLVHNGADLNAKNKHDETPADICEDLEMRARIAQLVTEREARARVSNGSGGPGSRRGTGGARPSSSRAHSVRRTSLRERGLTAKHDAHEEVRMRNTFTGAAQPNTGLPNGVENQISNGQTSPQKRSSNSPSNPNDPGEPIGPTPTKQPVLSHNALNGDSQSQISTDRESQSSSAAFGTLAYMNNPLYGVNAAAQYLPSGASTTTSTPNSNGNSVSPSGDSTLHKNNSSPTYPKSYPENGSGAVSPVNGVRRAPEGQDNESFIHEDDTDSSKGALVSASQLGLPTETSSATHYTSDKNGKINVHVTVMINTGTLADLKKQRAQIRNSSPTESSVISPGSPVDSSTATHSSPSPVQGDVPRFSGNTGDVVGDARSNRCCIIM